MLKKVLVDSNVLLDILTEDPMWYEWSATQLEQLAEQHILAINPIIYAEISIGFNMIEDLEDSLPETQFLRLQLPWEAAFLAGKAFMQYKKKGGTKVSTMPDFFIGSHGLVSDMIVLTRDGNRYKTYFPALSLICP